LRKSQSVENNKIKNKSMMLTKENISDQHFQLSLKAINQSKPSPNHCKKSCYDYRCNFFQNFNKAKKTID
jgi:hypothetical protein